MTATLSYGGAVAMPSTGMLSPQLASRGTLLSSFNLLSLDAAGEAIAMIGRVVLPARSGSKTISSAGGKIHVYLASTLVFANGTTSLDVGIQDLSGQNPDDSFDVSGTFVGGTDTLTASAINTFAMDTGTKAISHNQQVAVVLHLTARGGADLVPPTIYNMAGIAGPGHPYVRARLSGAWGSALSAWPDVLIEFDDGTFGWISGCAFVPNLTGTNSFNSGTAGFDEYGGRFRVPWNCSLESITVPVALSSTAYDFELCLYADILGTPTLLATATTFDASQWGGQADPYINVSFDALINISAGTVYGWTVRPTTVNSIILTHINYGESNNAKMASLMMGGESYLIKRLDNTGAFTEDNTLHVPHILYVAKLSDGASGPVGGGLVVGQSVRRAASY